MCSLTQHANSKHCWESHIATEAALWEDVTQSKHFSPASPLHNNVCPYTIDVSSLNMCTHNGSPTSNRLHTILCTICAYTQWTVPSPVSWGMWLKALALGQVLCSHWQCFTPEFLHKAMCASSTSYSGFSLPTLGVHTETGAKVDGTTFAEPRCHRNVCLCRITVFPLPTSAKQILTQQNIVM